MMLRKVIIAVVVVLMIVGGYFLINYIRNERNLINFANIIENDTWDDLTLTIYYMSLFTLTPLPLQIEDVMRIGDRIVVSGEELRAHADLLIQLDNANQAFARRSSRAQARIYYVFEYANRRTFSVVFWDLEPGYMVVNSRMIEHDMAFYDVIIPFLPEYIVQQLRSILKPILIDAMPDKE